MARLFGRQASLLIIREGVSEELGDFRIKFQVQKFLGEAGNLANITVYNMPLQLRAQVARRISTLGESISPEDTVILEAGYKGRKSIISRGVIIEATNTRIGPDWITEMLTYTALEQMANAVQNKAYLKTTSALNLIQQMFFDAKFPNPKFSQEALTLLQGKSVEDFTVQGSIMTSAIRLLDRYNLYMTIDDESRVLIAPNGKAFDASQPDTAIQKITDKTGLIGSPQITKLGANVKMLLNPQIKPMSSFIIGAQTISELPDRPTEQRYTARQVTHIGDTRGDDWFTEVEGIYPNLNPSSAEYTLRQLEQAVRS